MLDQDAWLARASRSHGAAAKFMDLADKIEAAGKASPEEIHEFETLNAELAEHERVLGFNSEGREETFRKVMALVSNSHSI
jgi:hypothetical protein